MAEYLLPQQMTVLEAIRKLYPDSSRRTLQTWLKGGRFTVDGDPLRQEKTILDAGKVVVSQEQAPTAQPGWGIKILYSDQRLIVIDKPEGLLSVPLDDEGGERHALGLLRQHFHTELIYAVHRLDRESSGVLMFARGKESQDRLRVMFAAHDLEREYFAIVEGRVKEEKGTWTSILHELPSFDVITTDDPDEGKEAITHFTVQRRSAKYTYLKLLLETGRKHQIRVHASSAGHPIVGDERYGALDNPIDRLCLHACRLAFVHPFTKEKMSFASPLPGSFMVLGGKI